VDILILGALILVNGLFAMAELAVVSSRKARLQPAAEGGSLGARAALALHSHPTVFLSTVQVGITIVGVSSGAVGESAIADPLAAWLSRWPALAPYAYEIALPTTIILITYFSVVVGELVPKRLALRAPEKIATLVALPMMWVAKVAKPLVWAFSASSEVILRVLGAQHHSDPPVSNAEIEGLMEQGAEAGIFHESEQQLVANILRLDEQRVAAIMTPRNDIALVDLSDPPEVVTAAILESPRSRIVVCRDGLENVLGVLHIVDLLKRAAGANDLSPAAIEASMRSPLHVPKSITTVHLLEQFKHFSQHFALVVGEYGEVQGVVTLTDVLTSIVGDLEPDRPSHERDIIERGDGTWLCDGGITIEHLRYEIGIDEPLPAEGEEDFHTLGGYIMHILGHIPHTGESFTVDSHRFEVVDMDGNRIDKVLVSRMNAEPRSEPVDDDLLR